MRLLPFSCLLLCALTSGPRTTLAQAYRQARRQLEFEGIFQRTLSRHDRQISFVHRVRNNARAPLRQVEISLAVPRNNARQHIHRLEFTPKPTRTTTDGWEQETAYFEIDSIPAGGEAEVRLKASVTLLDLQWMLTDRDVGTLDEIPERVVRHYLRNGDNYKLEEAIVQRAAKRIKANEGSILERVRRIHDFVIDTIEYSRDDRWDPADRVLREGKGSCSEYSYLMIALLRLNGIPARYAGGSWIEKNGVSPPRDSSLWIETFVDRIFHRWVEVYLPRCGWFPVDPTQDDVADKEGDPYRYFGRLPWSYFTLTHGDGDKFESGPLGWEYRSNTRWLGGVGVESRNVLVERFAIWKAPEIAAGAAAGN